MKKELIRTREFTGRLEWIGIAAEAGSNMESRETAELVEAKGISGDRHGAGRRKKRQVTLIQAEHLPVVARLLDAEGVYPSQLRRNLLISGINLASLKGRDFTIGDAHLRGTGDCVPCERMEETLGPGGYDAMVGHGGLTAAVITGGTVTVGDEVRCLR